MTGEHINHLNPPSTPGTTSWTHEYDPFARGRFPVGVRTIQALDMVRNRLFPCEVWYPAAAQHAGQDLALATQDFFTVPPNDTLRSQMAVRNAAAQPGRYTLILFSYSSGGRWRQSTFLCTHLSSHGYVVAALDHSEVIAPELRRREGETDEQKTARVAAWIANRVPDIRFLLDQRWSHRLSAHSEDFTDQEAVAAILRITRGNMRLIDRLMMQVEHVLVANQLQVVTKEVVETARENLIIGLN